MNTWFSKFIHILIAILFLLLFISLFQNVIFKEGLIEYGDFTVPFNLENYINFYYPLWNPFGSTSTSQFLPRLLTYGPLLAITEIAELGIGTLEKLLALLPIIISFFSMYIASNFLIKKIYRNIKEERIAICSFFPSFVYALNPWIISETRHFSLIWGYAFIPLILILFIRYLEARTDYKQFFILALLLSFASITPQWIVFNGFILFSWLLYDSLSHFLKKDWHKIFENISKSVGLLAICIMINAYWIIPLFISNLYKVIHPSYVSTYEVLGMLSRNANLINVERLIGDWWPQTNWNHLSHTILWKISSFILPLFAFATILSKPRNKYIIYFFLMALLFLFLGMGTRNPFPEFYYFLSFNSTPLNKIGWVFRNPSRWASLLALTYSFLILFMVLNITRKKWIKYAKIIPIAILIIFCSLFAFYAFPTINGYSTKILDPVQVPEEYYAINEWLEAQNKDFSVTWLHPYESNTLTWSYANPNFAIASSSKPTIGPFTPYTSQYMRYIYSKCLLNNESSNFGKYLGFLNTRYILFHSDISGAEKEAEKAVRNLNRQKDLKFTKQEGFISVFENPTYADHINILHQNVVLLGRLDKFTSLNSINSFNPTNTSLLFLHQTILKNKYKHTLTSDILIIDENSLDLALSLLENKCIVKSFDATNHHNPSKIWSKAATNDPLHGPWHPYLEKRNIENWDFDYGKGLVFTWSPSVLKEPYLLKKEDLLAAHDFEDNTTNWNINAPNIQKMFLTNMSHHGKSSLAVELNASEWGWKTINSPLISVNYGSQYKWELYVKGKDAYKVHAKVIECKETKEIINAYYMSSIDSGDFDWEKVSFNFIPSSPDTKYMQLQLWHGHETNQTLPNRIWIDDVKIYNLSGYLKPNSLEIPFNVEKDGNYELFIRYFKNQDGGKIGLHLDGELLDIIETEDQLNKFTWGHLKTLDLKRGSHTLTLENIVGFNAVNIFALIPANEYKNIELETYDLLKDKRVIYLFEAETDLYRKNTEVLNVGGKASNGELLQLQADSKIWGDIEIQRDGNYTVALRLNGSALIKIDNQTFTVNSTYLDFVYFNLHLMQGQHRIELLSEQHQPIIWTFDKTEKDFEEWKENTPESLIYDLSQDMENEKNCLKAELNNSTWGWKTINSPLIPISSNKEYLWGFEIKEENAHAVHVKVAEYNKSKNIIQAVRLGSIGDGTFDWTNVSFSFKPTSANTSYMQLQIWHGHNTPQPLPNTIWLDNVRTYSHSPSQIDVLWIYSAKENETIDDIFSPKENPAKIITYEKVDPTKYILTINATSPFMLSFAESYDPLWVAYVDGTEYQPMPLYSVINGFWINKTGDLEIVLRYKPQDWFEIGSIISITALMGCVGYLLYDWKKNDERIKMIKRKIYTILKKKK